MHPREELHELLPCDAGWTRVRCDGAGAVGPSGRMRRLVLDAPESTPADVARLVRDPEAEVRRRAAEDPRLSPADAVRLLNDPEWLRP
ncbi:hypothetical protein [Streptomyces scabiei]|uniref:hypothetical protein n=1 Tax=Streptomyces scabiei TaxID=1930 RepID=UPI0029A2CB70|nr:hypothetical protein [Streptomyces scabiei]MDX3517829.1 hypothetical protein [Streptomyces scabiei]